MRIQLITALVLSVLASVAITASSGSVVHLRVHTHGAPAVNSPPVEKARRTPSPASEDDFDTAADEEDVEEEEVDRDPTDEPTDPPEDEEEDEEDETETPKPSRTKKPRIKPNEETDAAEEEDEEDPLAPRKKKGSGADDDDDEDSSLTPGKPKTPAPPLPQKPTNGSITKPPGVPQQPKPVVGGVQGLPQQPKPVVGGVQGIPLQPKQL